LGVDTASETLSTLKEQSSQENSAENKADLSAFLFSSKLENLNNVSLIKIRLASKVLNLVKNVIVCVIICVKSWGESRISESWFEPFDNWKPTSKRKTNVVNV